MTRDEILAEFKLDAAEVLANRKLDRGLKVDALVALLADLLDPGAVSAVDVVGARMTMARITYESGTVCLDGDGDLAGVEFDVPVEIEWRERQQ